MVSLGQGAVLIAFILAVFSAPGFGSARASNVTVNIAEIVNGSILDIIHDNTVTQYDTMNITIVFKNTGSAPYNALIIGDIINYTIDRLERSSDIERWMIPGDIRKFTFYYVPNVTGYQWVRANVTFGGERLFGWSSFFVEEYVAPTVTDNTGTTPGDTGAGAAAPSPREVGIAKMELEYPDYVRVSRGRSQLVYIKVNNLGGYGNASLDNTIFYAQSMGVPFSVVPHVINSIESGKSGFFLVTLNVPMEIDPGYYELVFTVRSDEDEVNGSIEIDIANISIMSDIPDIIANYRFIIERLGWEIRQGILDGANMEIAQKFLDASIYEVDTAEEQYFESDYDSSYESLKMARNNLERTVLEIANARELLYRLFLPGYVTLLIIIAIILTIITVLFFLITRRRKKEKEEEVEKKA